MGWMLTTCNAAANEGNQCDGTNLKACKGGACVVSTGDATRQGLSGGPAHTLYIRPRLEGQGKATGAMLASVVASVAVAACCMMDAGCRLPGCLLA